MIVTEPCVVRDMPEDEYHRDPVEETSLSQTGAKLLLQSPAKFRYQQQHPLETDYFDLGKVAHRKILGVGAEIAVVDRVAKDGTRTPADDWRSPSTQAHRDEIRAAGMVPLLARDVEAVDAMAAALWEHLYMRVLFKDGIPEQSLFWRDDETRVMLRARLDWTTRLPSGRPCIVDVKTTGKSAAPEDFCWDARRYGYHMQDAWYREGADTLLEAGHAFVLVVQEKQPPFLPIMYEFDDDSRERGAYLNGVARRRYSECMTSGEWPGFDPVIHSLHVPNSR